MNLPAVNKELELQNWLLLVFQLPARPAYLRVKTWRRLQDIGAVAVKNTVYALPANAETQEDFQWLLNEIQQGGGEGMICEARLIDGLSDAQVRELFDRARDADYEAITTEAQVLAQSPAIDKDSRANLFAQANKLRRRLLEIANIDFFGANARETAEGLLMELENKLKDSIAPASEQRPGVVARKIKAGSTWVTRRGVKVDRIASAWLIGRFIDNKMQLKFVEAKGYAPLEGELRFDMFEAEFTHEGNLCTFEVLIKRMGLNDPALGPIAEIVHDIDIKDGKFAREETSGIKTLIEGICVLTSSDEERVRRGSNIFEELYGYFSVR